MLSRQTHQIADREYQKWNWTKSKTERSQVILPQHSITPSLHYSASYETLLFCVDAVPRMRVETARISLASEPGAYAAGWP